MNLSRILRLTESAIPETTLAEAWVALQRTVEKFDAAATHASKVAGQQGEEIDVLSDVIATKAKRQSDLTAIADQATKVRDSISKSAPKG